MKGSFNIWLKKRMTLAPEPFEEFFLKFMEVQPVDFVFYYENYMVTIVYFSFWATVYLSQLSFNSISPDSIPHLLRNRDTQHPSVCRAPINNHAIYFCSFTPFYIFNEKGSGTNAFSFGNTQVRYFYADSIFLPLARLRANTFLPALLLILARNPCLFFLFLLLGWNVLFISTSFL